MNYKPIFDRVIAVELEQNKMTDSGIALLADNESVKKAEVVAVGDGAYEDGVFVTMKVAVGSKILFENHCAVPFFSGGKKFLLIKQTDILAVEENLEN